MKIKFQNREGKSMEERDYLVSRIEGEYATLTDIASGEELFIALALLPPSVDLHVKLHYENFSFSVAD